MSSKEGYQMELLPSTVTPVKGKVTQATSGVGRKIPAPTYRTDLNFNEMSSSMENDGNMTMLNQDEPDESGNAGARPKKEKKHA